MTQRSSRPAKKHRLANVRRSASGKWVSRYRACGESGLLDRSSTPECVANRTDERRVEAIAALRRLRLTSAEIAELLGMALSMVSGILTRIRMGRLGRLGLEPAERYDRERPGELVHIDAKKLGRIHGGAVKRTTGIKRNPGREPVVREPDRRRGICAWMPRRDAQGVDAIWTPATAVITSPGKRPAGIDQAADGQTR